LYVYNYFFHRKKLKIKIDAKNCVQTIASAKQTTSSQKIVYGNTNVKIISEICFRNC